jgi:hypothetical protein
MIRLLITFLCLFLPLFGWGSIAAQEPTSIQPPKHLGEILPRAYWNVNEWGVLLAISPEYTVSRRKRREYTEPLPPMPPRGYNLNRILELLDYRTIKTGTVAAVAPTYMRVFTRPTITPEDAVNMGKEEACSALLASFTSNQWQLVGSTNGIGRGDLSEKQQRLYDAILPKEGTLQPQSPEEPTAVSPPVQRPAIPLTPTLLQQLRFRISKKVEVLYAYEGANSGFTSFGEGDMTTEYYLEETSSDFDKIDMAEEWSGDIDRSLLLKMYPKVPNRLKQSDLDYKSARLNSEILLKNIKTVEDLVIKIGDVTKLLLIADARVAKRKIYVRGEAARAGDLLQALCLATTGTFRKVGNSFVLTESLEGIGTRMAAYHEWQENVSSLHDAKQKKRDEQMRQNNMTLVLDDPYGMSKELQKKIARFEDMIDDGPNNNHGVDVTLLPEKLRQIVAKNMGRTIDSLDDNNQPTHHTLRTDKVYLQSQVMAHFLLPGRGSFQKELTTVNDLDDTPKATALETTSPTPFVMPAAWRKRGLIASVKNTDEALKTIQLARASGFTKLLLALPPVASKAKPILEEAIKVGKNTKIEIGLYISPLNAQRNLEFGSFTIDKNIFGETSIFYAGRVKENSIKNDYIYFYNNNYTIFAPDINTILKIQKEYNAILKTNDISEILYYHQVVMNYKNDEYGGYYGNPMGFHLGNRQSFLQKEHVDPIDIVADTYESLPVKMPYFSPKYNETLLLPDDRNIPNPYAQKDWYQTWRTFLKLQVQGLDTRFFKTLSESKTTTTPLYTILEDTDMIVPWKQAKVPFKQPVYKDNDDYRLVQARVAQKLYPTLALRITPWGDDQKEWEDLLISSAESDIKAPFVREVLFDLSMFSYDQMCLYLQALQKKIEKK